ncbi:MAG: hypothetical protein Q8M29_08310 [Bacteroidota bacterium]|nr:hypothetical protein [Bacteroidota bacterium]
MDKNKKNIDAEEFFKLLDADKDQDLSHLDDFDKEALEGLKMMKDHKKLNTLNTSIDEKLEELIAEEKKGKGRTGLYFLSIAASIALVIGLFFVFKKSEVKNEMALAKETTGEDMTPATGGENFEKKLEETNSDAQVTDEEVKEKSVPNKPLMEPNQTNGPVYGYGSGMLKQNEEQVNPPVPAEKEMDFDAKNISNGDVILDDNVVTAKDAKDKQNKVALAEETKPVTVLENSVAATSTGNTNYYNTQSPGTVVNGTTDLSKVSTKTAEVKGKKKENRNYKADEGIAPVFQESKKETTSLTSTNVAANKANDNSSNNTNTNLNSGAVITDNIAVRSEDESGKLNPKVVQPEFLGGKIALDEYIKKNLIIPASCTSEEIVIVRFTVDAVGKVVKPKIVSKTGNCKDCEKEAIRFVKAMPAWLAGTADGKAFEAQKTLTLSFKK